MTDYRETTGISGGGQTGAKGSDATLGSVTVSPETVKPGGTVNIQTRVVENIFLRGINDQDGCVNTGLNGISVTVSANIPGLDRSNDEEACIIVWSSQSGGHDYNFDIPIPENAENGKYSVDIVAKMSNTGNKIGEESKTINVSESGQGGAGCATDQDCGDGFVCVNGTCVEESETSNGANWTKWILNNPGKAAVLGVGSVAVMKYGLGE